MNELNLLSLSHIFTVLISILTIIYLPRYFEHSSSATKQKLRNHIILLLLVNQAMDFYREGIMSERWQEGLPLHLCDFSTMAIILYFITLYRDFFVFAFFFGIAGGGMSILTPDTVYGFPYIGYIQSQIGHTMILLGVTYAMVIDNQRPFLKDVPKVFMYATILLAFTYFMNYLLGTNYWFLAEKPIGNNITAFMRAEPFHIIDFMLLHYWFATQCICLSTLKIENYARLMERKGSKIVSRRQIPHKYRASRPKIVQWIARLFLRLFGWKVDGFIPPLKGNENLIIIAGPHTSNWDGVFGFAAILGLDAKITFWKHSLFTKPILGKFLKYMGGIPVDKTKPGSGLTEVAIQNMKKLNGSLIAMSPEGTRAKLRS